MRSIEARLKWGLLAASVTLSALLGFTAWYWVGQQVRDLLDYQLEQVARALVDHDFGTTSDLAVDDPAMHLDIAMWDLGGRLLYRSSPELELRPDTAPGFSRVKSGSQGDAVMLRLFTLHSGSRIIQVAHPLALRQELAREAGFEILAQTLLGTAALSLLIVFTVRRSLASLRELSRELSQRGADSLAPIELPHAPAELQAPLAVLNAMLERLHISLQLHRQFVADAAHELRTPLAAVRLQAGNLAHAADAAQREEALRQLNGGIERVQRLVRQLLELARLESSTGLRRGPAELSALARDCLVDHAAQAAVRDMELALDAPQPAWIDADAYALRSLMDNLVGNALKYSRSGTPVIVSIRNGAAGVVLSVRDHGPGIAPAARERVLERFYRHGDHEQPGSGLGLAIAAEAARRHDAKLELLTPDDGPGLEARVMFRAMAAD